MLQLWAAMQHLLQFGKWHGITPFSVFNILQIKYGMQVLFLWEAFCFERTKANNGNQHYFHSFNFTRCTASFFCSNVCLVSDSSLPPETTIKYRMFQTIVRHNGRPRNIAVQTNAEIKPRLSLCLRQMWAHSRQNSNLQKWFWTQPQHQNPVSTTTHVTCAFYWLRMERGRGCSVLYASSLDFKQ